MIIVSQDQPAWRRFITIFAAQAPAIEVPLRIPSGDEVIPVESGQRETSHNYLLGSRGKIIMTRLDRDGARLPGDES